MEEIGSFMSDAGRRKPTQGLWTIGPKGEMSRGSNEVVVIEEAPVPSAVDRREEPTAPKHVPPPMPPGRKSAVEEFNEELAVLERPLEGEVEYFEDAQPPSRWRQAGAFLAVVVVVGVGGSLLISRNRAAADARELAAGQASPAAAVAAAPPPALAAAQTPPAPAAPEAPAAVADAPAADEAAADSAGEDSAQPAPATRSAWTKVRTKAAHSKHARSGSKTTTHRTTKTKRTVIAKNTTSRRH